MFGQKNPKRVAERQLNQAELDLLEVSTALESYQSNKKTLEDRIIRLRAYLAADNSNDLEQAVARPAADVRGLGLNHAEYEIGGKGPRAAY